MAEFDYKKKAIELIQGRNLFLIEREQREMTGAGELFMALGNELTRGRFIVNDNNRFVYKNCLAWLFAQPFECLDPDNKDATIQGDVTKGLYIAGGCGTGKSLLLRILAAIGKEYGLKIKAGRKDIPLVWGENRADDICNSVIFSGIEPVARMRDADILNINDFGSGSAEQVYMGNRINAVRLIMESRADAYGRLTLITSNFPIGHEVIKEQFGDRVISRLREMCNYFELKGNDFRNPKNQSK